jgi:hypothetical protein
MIDACAVFDASTLASLDEISVSSSSALIAIVALLSNLHVHLAMTPLGRDV